MSLAHTLPFKDPRCSALHSALVAYIKSPAYVFELPFLSKQGWALICNNTKERERLEFLGDALIGQFVAKELYKCRPDEGPGYYTAARSVLVANSTFAYMMYKGGHHNIHDPVKPAGDAFETILAVYENEQGTIALNEYAEYYFTPLIEVVGRAYDVFRRTTVEKRRRQNHHIDVKSHLLTMASKRSRSKGRKLLHPVTNAPTIQQPMRSVPTQSQAKKSVLVDLTADSDSEDEIKEVQFHKRTQRRASTSATTNQKGKSSTVKLQEEIPEKLQKRDYSQTCQSQTLLRAISMSPRVRRQPMHHPVASSSASSSSSALFRVPTALPTRQQPNVQDDLVATLRQITLSGTGSSDNPFIID